MKAVLMLIGLDAVGAITASASMQVGAMLIGIRLPWVGAMFCAASLSLAVILTGFGSTSNEVEE